MQSDVTVEVEKFFSTYRKMNIKDGERLISPDDPVTNIYYIRSGLVKQYDITSRGSEVVVNIFQKGAFFPLYVNLLDVKNQYFFDSLGGTEFYVAPVADVMTFLKTHSEVLLDVLLRVYSGSLGQQRRMVHLMGGTAENRLLFELITSVKRFGVKQSDGSFVLHLHEEDIASMSGLSRETVSRTLQKLKKRNLVQATHKQLQVFDLKALEELLDDTV